MSGYCSRPGRQAEGRYWKRAWCWGIRYWPRRWILVRSVRCLSGVGNSKLFRRNPVQHILGVGREIELVREEAESGMVDMIMIETPIAFGLTMMVCLALFFYCWRIRKLRHRLTSVQVSFTPQEPVPVSWINPHLHLPLPPPTFCILWISSRGNSVIQILPYTCIINFTLMNHMLWISVDELPQSIG